MTYDLSADEQSALWKAVIRMLIEQREKPSPEEQETPRSENYGEE